MPIFLDRLGCKLIMCVVQPKYPLKWKRRSSTDGTHSSTLPSVDSSPNGINSSFQPLNMTNFVLFVSQQMQFRKSHKWSSRNYQLPCSTTIWRLTPWKNAFVLSAYKSIFGEDKIQLQIWMSGILTISAVSFTGRTLMSMELLARAFVILLIIESKGNENGNFITNMRLDEPSWAK